MKTSIAFAAATLLLLAALSRPEDAAAAPRMPAKGAIRAPEQEVVSASTPALDALATSTLSPITPHHDGVWAEIARLLDEAYAGVYEERYAWTVAACERILRVDPHYGVALELRTLARRLQHIKIGDYDSIYRAIEPWVVRTGPASIPYPETFRIPSRDEWAELYAREARPVEEALTIEEVHRKLDLMIIDMDFERTSLEDALALLSDFSGLNIRLDANTIDRFWIQPPLTVRRKGVTLRQAIRSILTEIAPFWDMTVTQDRVILITSSLPGRPTSAEPVATGPGYPITDALPLREKPELFGFDAVLAATRVDLDVQNCPMSAIVDELRTRTGLDLRMRQEEEEEGYISFKVSQLNLRQVLHLLLHPRNLTYEIDGVTIRIGRVKGY